MPDEPSRRGIVELHLQTAALAAQRDFYSLTLGLPVANVGDSIEITAGDARLRFREAGSAAKPVYHFAFNIPENKFASAKAWLAQRVTLLIGEDGRDEFDFASWNAHACYFSDAAGNVVEFIARHDLANQRDGAFSAADVLTISEIGIVVDDVPGTVKHIEQSLDLKPYRPGTPAFVAVGTAEHLLIVVARGRPWFAAPHLAADVFPVEAVFSGGIGRLDFAPVYPYCISAGGSIGR